MTDQHVHCVLCDDEFDPKIDGGIFRPDGNYWCGVCVDVDCEANEQDDADYFESEQPTGETGT